jgi:hypothetical protein
MRFHYRSGNLYIVDAYKGLIAKVLVTEVDGVPLRFTNSVDVDQITEEVFFTDVGRNYWRSPHERVTTNAYSYSSGVL